MSKLSLGIDLSAAAPRIVVADHAGAIAARGEAATTTAKAVRDAVKRVLAQRGPVSAAAVAVASGRRRGAGQTSCRRLARAAKKRPRR